MLVFPIVCMEKVKEIKVPYYLRFHPWLMNDLVEKYPAAIWWKVSFVSCWRASLLCKRLPGVC